VQLDGVIFVFGGQDKFNSATDTTVSLRRTAGTSWQATLLATSVTPPARAFGASVLWVASQVKFVVFGGRDAYFEGLNDLWCLDLANPTAWAPLGSDSDAPVARAFHAAEIQGGRMVVQGGLKTATDDSYLLDVWQYDFVRAIWQELQFQASSPKVAGHTLVTMRDVLYSMGGSTPEGLTAQATTAGVGDSRWEPVRAAGVLPPPRSGHSLQVVARGQMMVLFGGTESGNVLLGDVWVRDMESQAWRERGSSKKLVGGAWVQRAAFPPARAFHGTVGWQESIIVFGGVTQTGVSDELWIYEVVIDSWRQVPKGATWPSARSHMAMSLVSNTLVIYGGFGDVAKSVLLSDGSTRPLYSPTSIDASVTNVKGMLVFDGITDEISIPAAQPMTSTIPFTVEFWAAARGFQVSYQGIWSKNSEDKFGTYFVRCATTSSLCYIVEGSVGPYQLRTSTVFNDGRWHHVATGHNGTHRYIVLDGEMAAVATTTGGEQNGPLLFGAGLGDIRKNYFDGYMADIRWWSVGRTAAQIKASMYTLAPSDRTGLEGRWEFMSESADGSFPDTSGNNRHAKAATEFSRPFRTASSAPTSDASDRNIIRFTSDFTQLPTVPSTPPGRADVAFAALSRDRMLLMGGVSANPADVGSPWLLDLSNQTTPVWTLQTSLWKTYSGAIHSGARGYLDNDGLVLLGRTEAALDQMAQVTASLSSKSLTLHPIPSLPVLLAPAIAADTTSALHVFGGLLPSGASSNALYTSPPKSSGGFISEPRPDFQLNAPIGLMPPPLYAPLMTKFGKDKLALVAGWGVNGPTDFIHWEYDGVTGLWNDITNKVTGHFARASCSLFEYSGPDANLETEMALLLWGGETSVGFRNDLRVFNKATLAWSEKACTGSKPTPRAYYAGAVTGGKLYIHGGVTDYWTVSSNTFSLDLKTLVWTDHGPSAKPNGPGSLWEHKLLYVAAENSLLLAFGQSSGSTLDRHNDLFLFSLTNFTWTPVTPKIPNGAPPPRRAPAATVLNLIPPRLLVFGGLGIKPAAGAQWGGDLSDVWTIQMDGSPSAWEWVPIAAHGSPAARAAAAIIPLQNQLIIYGGTTRLPAYSYIVDLWKFKSNSAFPGLTIVTGAGAKSAVAGERMEFTIESKNVFGQPQQIDGVAICVDEFQVQFISKANPVRFGGALAVGPSFDGCAYTVSYTARVSGLYQVEVTTSGVGVESSPFELNVMPAATSVAQCFGRGDGLSAATAGSTATFTLVARDRFGNAALSGDVVKAELSLEGYVVPAVVIDMLDGSYSAKYHTTRSGNYTLALRLGGVQVPGSPFTTQVISEQAYGPNCLVSGQVAKADAGAPELLILQTVDRFGNNVTFSSGADAVSIDFYRKSQRRSTPEAVDATVVKPTHRDTLDGRYALSYFAFYPGPFIYHIKVHGEEIKGSPLHVDIQSVYEVSEDEVETLVIAVISAWCGCVVIGVMLAVIPAVVTHCKQKRNEEAADDARRRQLDRSSSLLATDGPTSPGEPPDPSMLQQWDINIALQELDNCKKKPEGFKALMFFLFWFALFIVVQYLQQDPPATFLVNTSVRAGLAGYDEVAGLEGLWDYFTQISMLLFPDSEYNGQPLQPHALSYMHQYNKVVGGMLIIQNRAHESACPSSNYNGFYGHCHSGSASETMTVEGAEEVPDHFKYSEQYGGHALFLSVAKNPTEVHETLAKARDQLWLDKSTRKVTIKFASYNGELRLFSFAAIEFFFGLGGRMTDRTKVTVESAHMELYETKQDLVLMALELLLLVLIYQQVAAEVLDFKDTVSEKGLRGYFNSIWNYLDIISLSLISAVSVLRLIYVVFVLRSSINLPSSKYESSIEESSEKLGVMMFFSTLFILVTILRLFKFFEFQPRMNIISSTVQNSAQDMFHFFVLFFCVFLAFCVMALLLFGPHLINFNDMGRVVQTMGEIMLGEFDFAPMKDQSPTMAAMMFWSFTLIVYFVLVNVFLAILIDAYAEAKHVSTNAPSIATDLVQWSRQSLVGNEGVNSLEEALDYFKHRGLSAVQKKDVLWYLKNVCQSDTKALRKQMLMFSDLPGKKGDQDPDEITVTTLLKAAWTEYDLDRSGVLSEDEFKLFMQNAPIRVQEDQINNMMRSLDRDGDGCISYEEFMPFFQSMLLQQIVRKTRSVPKKADNLSSPASFSLADRGNGFERANGKSNGSGSSLNGHGGSQNGHGGSQNGHGNGGSDSFAFSTTVLPDFSGLPLNHRSESPRSMHSLKPDMVPIIGQPVEGSQPNGDKLPKAFTYMDVEGRTHAVSGSHVTTIATPVATAMLTYRAEDTPRTTPVRPSTTMMLG